MLTCTEEIFRGAYGFRVFGTESRSRQVSEYMERAFRGEKKLDKLVGVLAAIDTNPLMYSHEEKFKRLEKGVWEIKIGQIRLACVWDPKPINLVAIYGFDKKQDRWPERHLENMRGQRDLYIQTAQKRIGGDYYGRTGSIAGPSSEPG